MARTHRTRGFRRFARGVGLVTLLAAVSIPAQVAEAAAFNVACGDVYGPNGLVAAINRANAAPGPSGISLAGCVYTLTVPNSGDNGLPTITNTITVNGPGATIARSLKTGTADFRIFEVDPPGNLTLRGVTVANGRSFFGSGILNAATLSLSYVTVRNNTTFFLAGGVYNGGTANIANSSLVSNTAVGDFPQGGGMQNDGTAVLTNTSVVSNSVVSPTFSAVGGGIFNQGDLSMTGAHIDRNTASSGPDDTAVGSGLLNTATATVTNSTINGNRTVGDASALGGGVYNSSDVTLDHTAVSGNLATAGAAVGGGIEQEGGTVTLQNGTAVTSNTAGGPSGHGGGIRVQGGAVVLTSGSFVTNNTPDNCFPPGSVPGCTG